MTECFDYTQLDEIIIFKGADNSDVIEMSRNGKYINLKKDSEIDKKYYRFDLQKKLFERVNFYKTRDTKITPVNVKNITGWFKDCKIVTKDLHLVRPCLPWERTSSSSLRSLPGAATPSSPGTPK